jgi:hypothetical protein
LSIVCKSGVMRASKREEVAASAIKILFDPISTKLHCTAYCRNY